MTDDLRPIALNVTCACCGRTIPARDVFRRSADNAMVCGNCDDGEQPDCPNCG